MLPFGLAPVCRRTAATGLMPSCYAYLSSPLPERSGGDQMDRSGTTRIGKYLRTTFHDSKGRSRDRIDHRGLRPAQVYS